jgi:hypothetical protein
MSRLYRNLATGVAVALVALALAPATTASAAPPRPTTTNIAGGAAGWLAQQLSGGTHLVFPGTKFIDYGGSADAAFALAAAHVGRATIHDVVDYLGAHLNEYADYSGAQGGPYYGSVGKAAVAALVDGRNPNNFGGHHLLAELKADECPTKSTTMCTPGNNTGIFSSVSTSFIVIAEARGAKRDGSQFAPSANLESFFLSLQCGDGGFSSDLPAGDPCKPDVDATGYALMALQALGGHTSQIEHAASWLVSQRNADGSWTAQGGKNIDSTALAVAGLRIAGRTTARSVSWLRNQQVTSGPTVGKGAKRGALRYQGKFDPAGSIKGTSDGILGITRSSLATLDLTAVHAGVPVLALAVPHVQHAKVHPGARETVTGKGFAAGETVQASIHSKSVRSGVANDNGTVSLTFTVPNSMANGAHTIVLTGHRSHLQSKASFLVR